MEPEYFQGQAVSYTSAPTTTPAMPSPEQGAPTGYVLVSPPLAGHQHHSGLVPSTLVASLIGPDSAMERFCPPGWMFSVYDAELQNHFAIPSQQVLATTGSLKYATYHERHGLGTRFRFQLCNKYSQGRCPDGTKCGYIHAIIDPTAIGKSIHINENLADCNTVQDVVNSQYRPLHNNNRYRLVQDGVLVAVRAPNVPDETPQLIYSGNLLRTHGGLQAYNAALSQLNPATAQLAQSVRPRHCAHFQFRKMCNLGEECNFVHSMAPYVQPKFRRPSDAIVPTPGNGPPAYPQPAPPPAYPGGAIQPQFVTVQLPSPQPMIIAVPSDSHHHGAVLSQQEYTPAPTMWTITSPPMAPDSYFAAAAAAGNYSLPPPAPDEYT